AAEEGTRRADARRLCTTTRGQYRYDEHRTLNSPATEDGGTSSSQLPMQQPHSLAQSTPVSKTSSLLMPARRAPWPLRPKSLRPRTRQLGVRLASTWSYSDQNTWPHSQALKVCTDGSAAMSTPHRHRASLPRGGA